MQQLEQKIFEPLDHSGSRPDRMSNIEEMIFHNLWAEYNTGSAGIPHSAVLRIILAKAGISDIEQRDVTVAASMVQWLGTNIGLGFLCETKRAPRRGNRRDSLDCWAKKNTRRYGLNRGYTALEVILCTRLIPLDQNPGDLSLIDPISERDAKAAKAMIIWFSSEGGQDFIAEAETRIAAERSRLTSLHDKVCNKGALSNYLGY